MCQKKSIDLNIKILFYELYLVNSVIYNLIIEALSATKCTLLQADVALKFMLDELSTRTNSISRKLKNELIFLI